MAAAVVGTAYVRIRGVTTGLGSDIEDAVDSAGASMDLTKTKKVIRDSVSKAAGSGGADGGDRFADNFRRSIQKSSAFRKISDSWKKLSSSWGDESGRNFASRFNAGMMRGFSRDRAKQRRKINSELFDLFTVIKLPAIAWIAVLALPALGGLIKIAVSYIGALVGQIGYLLTAIVGVSTAAAGVGAGMAVAMLPLLLAFKAETPGLDKFKESIEEQGEAWMEVGAATQEFLLPALDRAFGSLSRLIPQFTTFGSNIGRIVGRMAELSAAALTSERNLENWGVIFGGSQVMMQDFSRIVQGLAGMLPGFLATIMPLSERLTGSFAAGFDRFTEMINAGVESGSLIETLTKWYDRAELFGGALMDIVRGLWNIFEVGGDKVEPMFENLSTWAANFLAWTESIEGSTALEDFFSNAVVVAQEINDLLGEIMVWMVEPIAEGKTEGIISFINILQDDWLPLLKELSASISKELAEKLLDLATAITTLLVSMNESGALGRSIDALGGMVDILQRILDIPGVGDFIAQMIGWGLAFSLVARTVKTVLMPLRILGRLFTSIWNLFTVGKWSGMQIFLKLLSLVGGGIKWLAIVAVPALWAGLKFVIVAIAGFFGAPVWVTVAAIIAIIIAVVLAFKNWDKIKEWVGKAWTWLKEFGSNALEWLKDLPQAIPRMAAEFGRKILDFVRGIPEMFVGAATALWQWIQDVGPVVAEKVGYLLGRIIGFLIFLPFRIIGALVGAGIALWQWIVDVVPTVIEKLLIVNDAIWAWVGEFVSELPGKIAGAAVAIWEWVSEAAVKAPGQLAAFASAVWEWGKTFIQELPGKFISFITGWAEFGKALVGAIVDGLNSAIGTVMSWGGKLISGISQGIYDAAPSWLQGALGWLRGGSIPGTPAAAGLATLEALNNALSAARGAVTGAVNAATDAIGWTPPWRNTNSLMPGVGSAAFAGGVPSVGSSQTNLLVQIGNRDITDIVDARFSDDMGELAHGLFVRRP